MAAADIERIVRAGHAALPEITVASELLAPLIGERLEGEEAPELLAADEVFLACACAVRDQNAIAAFERRYFSVIPAVLSRLALGPDDVAEIEQQLRIRLFVVEPDGVARVVSYAGRGQLVGLVRVAALRAGLNLLRDRGTLGTGGSDELEDVPIAVDDPELANLKVQHRAIFKLAFEDAIAGLSPRERSLLRLAIVKGVGIDRVGAIYGVHRATAARWIAQARETLTRAVHGALVARLRVTRADLTHLLPLVESQLELSLERLLRSKVE
jgi:RNA polymerase sigma-70 factor (ECF subfamily)